jgi:hypothetical protein
MNQDLRSALESMLDPEQNGWDDYTNWKRGGGEKPENPYQCLGFAKRAWLEGYMMAKRGDPRPETLGEVVSQ